MKNFYNFESFSDFSDKPTNKGLELVNKRINSSLLLKNELTINLFNLKSDYVKFQIQETSMEDCIFYCQINIEKYNQTNLMMSIANICKNHVENLNDTAFGYFFHVLVLVINHLHSGLKSEQREEFLNQIILYNSKAPNFQVHVFQDLFHSDFYNFSITYSPSCFEQIASDNYYEIFKSFVDKENDFLKYLSYLVFHLVR